MSADPLSFFFEPLVLHLQPADLLVELGFVILLRTRGLPALEEAGGAVEEVAFPVADLRGVDAEAGGELLGGLDALVGFEGDLRLEVGGVLLPFSHRRKWAEARCAGCGRCLTPLSDNWGPLHSTGF